MDSLETETLLCRVISHIGIQTRIALSQIGSPGMQGVPLLWDHTKQSVNISIIFWIVDKFTFNISHDITLYHHVDPDPAAFQRRLVPALLHCLQRYGLACAVALTPGQGGVLDTRACDSEAAGAGIPMPDLIRQNDATWGYKFIEIHDDKCVYMCLFTVNGIVYLHMLWLKTNMRVTGITTIQSWLLWHLTDWQMSCLSRAARVIPESTSLAMSVYQSLRSLQHSTSHVPWSIIILPHFTIFYPLFSDR